MLILETTSSLRVVMKWRKWNPRRRLLAFFPFLLIFIACVVQHLKDDAKTNLKDGKNLEFKIKGYNHIHNSSFQIESNP